MSEFSDKCRAFVEKSNTNIYQIAKKSGLDRTMLQKMVKGTKVPSEPFFEKFCEFLILNKTERSELEELFKIERIGRDVYASRCEIKKLLDEFSKLNGNKSTERQLPVDTELGGLLVNEDSIAVDSMFDLVDAIRYVIKEECQVCDHPQIYLDVFEMASFALNQILKYGQNLNKQIDCVQFVKLYRSNPTYNSTVENIQVLRTIFPFAFKYHHSYNVFYSYINGNRSDGNYNIWDHCIVTQTKVLLISESCQKGLLVNSPSVAASYIERMKNMQEECEPFFEYFEHEGEVCMEQRIELVKICFDAKTMNCLCACKAKACKEIIYSQPYSITGKTRHPFTNERYDIVSARVNFVPENFTNCTFCSL